MSANKALNDIKVKTNLRVLRAIKEVSQDDVARAVGVTRTTIGRIERGETDKTNIKLALLLAKYFQRPVDDIFFINNGTQIKHF